MFLLLNDIFITESELGPPFDPEIERTISLIRRARRWLASKASFKEETSSSPTKSINTSFIDLGTNTMVTPRKITLKEAGALDFTLQPFQVRHPNLTADFELKTTFIYLLPKFHGLPTQEPIKHLRDFQIACSTTRRHGADEVDIWLYAFPFSLERRVVHEIVIIHSLVTAPKT
ncbi:hypothetical protein AHAS_Ahas19G0208700 [Arachis hypogaea]